MKLICSFFLLALMGACSKTAKDENLITTCPAPVTLTWLTEKKAEYKSCSCLIGFRQGIYQNLPVIEVYLYDPRCNGFNIVYKIDGTRWFTSAEPLYADYQASVKEQRIFWTCSGGDQ